MSTLEQQRDQIEAVRDRLHELARHHARMTDGQVSGEIFAILGDINKCKFDDSTRAIIDIAIDGAMRASRVAPTIFVNYLECARWELLSKQMALYNVLRKLDPSYD